MPERVLSIIVFILVFITVFGCKDHVVIPDLEEPKEVRVDFQGWFTGDFVTVLTDRTVVFADTNFNKPDYWPGSKHSGIVDKRVS